MSINKLRGNTQESEQTPKGGITDRLKARVYRRMKKLAAAAVFCMVLGMGIVCMAEEPGKVTVASAVIRASADTSSTALGSVKQNETVSIIEETTGADGKVWYKVFVNATTTGYIRGDLVQKTGSTDSDTATATETPAANTTTQVTAVDNRTGTVVTSNVRIRKGASTNADVVATANRGMVVTVTGEAAGTDGKTWYQISFSYNSKNITGFIRSDLVTFDSLPADTAVSEITGTEGEPEEGTTEEPVSTEEPVQEPEPEETPAQDDDTAGIILLNVEETPYVMPGFSPIILKWEDQDINSYKNGAFYIFYAQKQSGEEGWYIFDSENGTYQRYPYAQADVTIGEEDSITIGLIPVVILVVIIVILIAIIGLLFLRLRGVTDGYDDEYDEYGDEEEDLEELEIEEEELEEVRQPERPRQPRTPSRPQPRQERAPRYEDRDPREDTRPVRKPEPAQGNAPVRREGERPARRPESAQTNAPVRREGERPARRPESAQGNASVRREEERPVRRQEGAPYQSGHQGNGSNSNSRRQDSARRQGTQQRPNKNEQQQKGYKAKNFLEAEDDDMEFMDL